MLDRFEIEMPLAAHSPLLLAAAEIRTIPHCTQSAIIVTLIWELTRNQ